MTPFQQLDAAFPNVLALVVGQCTSVTIPSILAALNTQDLVSALETFQSWSLARGFISVQLTIDFMMVGRHLAVGV